MIPTSGIGGASKSLATWRARQGIAHRIRQALAVIDMLRVASYAAAPAVIHRSCV
jgi:hypothetical protein